MKMMSDYGGIRSIFSERSVCPNHVFIKKNRPKYFASRLMFGDTNSPIHRW